MLTGRSSEAIAHLVAAVDLNPNYAEAHYNLAVLLENLGRTDDAISQLQRAVKSDPGRQEVQTNQRTDATQDPTLGFRYRQPLASLPISFSLRRETAFEGQ